MKAIINGRKYDTDTATLIARDSYSNPGDFHHWCEELYQKRNSEFFLFGEGGPMSKYSIPCGNNSRSGGIAIIPLDEDEAKEWLEEHSDGDTYEKVFGEVDE